MKIYQIVIHISLFLCFVVKNYANDTSNVSIKYKKLYHTQQKYLNWVDKKDKEFPMGIPIIAGNKYDGVQIGAALINLKQPVKNVDFTGVLLYGTRSKKINGIADIAYYIQPNNDVLNKIKISANFKSFSYVHEPKNLKYYALKPEVQFDLFSKKNAKITHQLSFKSNLIYEQVSFLNTGFKHNKDATLKRFYANEFAYQFIFKNSNFPFHARITFEQAKQFGKLSIEAQSFIKYQLKKYNTGLHLRFFSGTFLYRNNAFRPRLYPKYGFTMSGTTGINDYKYDDFYFGRNEIEGMASNQIANGNGNMKFISPPVQAYQEGRTMNYLIALNIVADFPVQYVPIKFFADFGYSSDKQINTLQNLPYNKFYYDLGLMFSFLNRGVEFYIPFLVSKEVKELNKTYRPKLGQRISFLIDLEKLNLNKQIRKLHFN